MRWLSTNHRLDPTETVLHITVEVEGLTPTTEVRGRLMGPRCAYSSTVEIAYAYREIERGDHVTLAVVIPEPSWWDPETPFLYEGPLELWQDNQLSENMHVGHGIRWLQITSRGLRLNGHSYILRGKIVEPNCTDTEMQRLRDAGFNAVFAASSGADSDLKGMGDRHGLFVSLYALNQGVISGSNLALDILERLLACQQKRWGSRQRVISARRLGHHLPGRRTVVRRGCLLKIKGIESIPEPLPHRPDVIGWIEAK